VARRSYPARFAVAALGRYGRPTREPGDFPIASSAEITPEWRSANVTDGGVDVAIVHVFLRA
jgi:hypothetical protein